jgi:hypothetical protein
MKLHLVKTSRKVYPCVGGDSVQIGEPYGYIEPSNAPCKCFCLRHPPKPSDLDGSKPTVEAEAERLTKKKKRTKKVKEEQS